MKTFIYCMILTGVLNLSLKAQGFGNALQFDGIDDYVDMGNATTLDVGTTVTYEAWIRPDTSLTGMIFNKWVAFAEDKQFIFSGNQVYFYLYNVFNGVQLVSSPSVPLHEYTHVAATYDGSIGVASIYINGVFDTSKSVGNGVSNSSGNLYYGYNPARNDFIAPFKGIIDEVRIWNIARTESEIQSTIYQTLTGNETGLVGYWKFDEGTGTIATDETGNQNNGTISGATWVISGIVEVESEQGEVPTIFSLAQNYPNPFNPTTAITYQLAAGSDVILKVFDILGNEIATLVNEYETAGRYEVEFNTTALPSGIYLYQLRAGNFIESRKMVLMK